MNRVNYSAVVCTDLANGIGKSGEGLLWHIPSELQHFQSLTKGHPVVMGRKTFETIGKPLSDRQNIIVTRNKDYQTESFIVIHSPEEIEQLDLIDNEVMIIGGLEIYNLFWNKISTIYQSVVQVKDARCNLFFPRATISDWSLEFTQFHVNFNFFIYRRK